MKRLVVLLAAVAMLFTFAPTAFAGTQGSCSSPGAGSIRLWENEIGDTSDGNDSIWLFCNAIMPTAIVNLGNVSHTLSGGCKALNKIGDNWNDCVSSITVYLPSSLWVACTGRDNNLGGIEITYHGVANGVRYNLNTLGDSLSSVKLDNDGTCP